MVLPCLLLIAAGLIAFAWLGLTLAANALPILAAIAVARFVLQAGGSWMAATVTAGIAGLAVLLADRAAACGPAWLRHLTTAVFVAPAAWSAWQMACAAANALHLAGWARSVAAALLTAAVVLSVPGRLRPAAPGAGGA